MSTTVASARSFAREDRGAAMPEYALILAIVAVGSLLALGFLSGEIGHVFERVSDNVESVFTKEDAVEIAKRRGHGWYKRFGG